MADESVLDKVKDEFTTSGSTSELLYIPNLTRFKEAWEIIDGVDDVRKSLETAAFGDPSDPFDNGGHLDKAIGKELGFTGNFTATTMQRNDYIDKIVSESADSAHAKALVIWSTMVTMVRTHLAQHHEGIDPLSFTGAVGGSSGVSDADDLLDVIG